MKGGSAIGTLVNSIFSLLLGWIRTAAQAVWNAAAPGASSGLLTWLGDNWLPLALVLCVICTAIEVIVHLFRWRPQIVWLCFFRRLIGGGKHSEPAKPAAYTPASVSYPGEPSPQLAHMTVSQQYRDPTRRRPAVVPAEPEEDEDPSDRNFFRRGRRAISSAVRDLDGEQSIVYTPTRTGISQKDAYNEPVYPRSRKDGGARP